MLREYCDNDPAKLKAIKVRFSRPTWPGDTIVTSLWRQGDRIHLEAVDQQRGTPVLTQALVTLR